MELLRDLRGLEPLKKLFWSELNYDRVNQPLSRCGWNQTAANALAEDPVLFAGGGAGEFDSPDRRRAEDGAPAEARALAGTYRASVSRRY